ncbi:MAG: enoyl-CoA hydratase/isomerase family protein [Pseudomonadota bacterium]
MADILDEEDLGEGVRILRLNRPPASALNTPFLLSIAQRLNELAHMETLRALVLTGTGKVLSAGLDLKEAVSFSLAEQTAVCDALNRAYGALYGFPKPVIAAVNGHAIAGGLFFVLAADYRIAADGSRFGLTEVRVGVRFPVSALEIAREELSPTLSRRLLLSGRNIEAAEALDHKLLDEVVSAGDVMDRAVSVARDYATIPPIAYSDVKQQLRAQALAKIGDAVENGNDPTLHGWFTEESQMAASALLAAATKGKDRRS